MTTPIRVGRAVDRSRVKSPLGPLPLPRRCWLDYATVYVVESGSEVTAPNNLTVYFTRDEEGRVPVGNRLDGSTEIAEWEGVVLGAASEPYGGASIRIDLPFAATPEGEALYMWCYGDNSTNGLTVRAEVMWRVLADHELTCPHRERLRAEAAGRVSSGW